jgi:Asp-tRNA(Asn)/Glu-tRNA(Gln) amidotransferase B subunit
MSLAEQLLGIFMKLPEEKKKEAIDFVEYLDIKNKRELEKMMNDVISENKEALEELSK